MCDKLNILGQKEYNTVYGMVYIDLIDMIYLVIDSAT